MQIARDHLVGLAHLDHVVDALELLQLEALEAGRVADESDDRVHRAAGHERLAARVAHHLGDGGDLLVRRSELHHHDHVPAPRSSAGPRSVRPDGPCPRKNPGSCGPGSPADQDGGRRLPRAVPEEEVPASAVGAAHRPPLCGRAGTVATPGPVRTVRVIRSRSNRSCSAPSGRPTAPPGRSAAPARPRARPAPRSRRRPPVRRDRRAVAASRRTAAAGSR